MVEDRPTDNRTVAFLQRWLVTTLAVLVAAHIIRGIHYDSFPGLLVASLFLGVLNAFVRPVLLLLSLPLWIATLGLIVPVINGVLLYLVGQVVPSFHVDGPGAAFWGALVISIVSSLVNGFARVRTVRVQGWRPPPSAPPPPPPGRGPIIDV